MIYISARDGDYCYFWESGGGFNDFGQREFSPARCTSFHYTLWSEYIRHECISIAKELS